MHHFHISIYWKLISICNPPYLFTQWTLHLFCIFAVSRLWHVLLFETCDALILFLYFFFLSTTASSLCFDYAVPIQSVGCCFSWWRWTSCKNIEICVNWCMILQVCNNKDRPRMFSFFYKASVKFTGMFPMVFKCQPNCNCL